MEGLNQPKKEVLEDAPSFMPPIGSKISNQRVVIEEDPLRHKVVVYTVTKWEIPDGKHNGIITLDTIRRDTRLFRGLGFKLGLTPDERYGIIIIPTAESLTVFLQNHGLDSDLKPIQKVSK